MEIKPDPENQLHTLVRLWRNVERVLRGDNERNGLLNVFSASLGSVHIVFPTK